MKCNVGKKTLVVVCYQLLLFLKFLINFGCYRAMSDFQQLVVVGLSVSI